MFYALGNSIALKTPEHPSSSRERELFLRALEKRVPAERRSFLEAACGNDEALRAAVEALFEHYQEDSFLEKPPGAFGLTVEGLTSSDGYVPDENTGDRIGRFKLLHKVGEGGCGVVYMAEQGEPFRRRVALKIIRLGMDTKAVIARFEAERQALAMMDHPNIAKVFDAGTTQMGRPYFVMELVRGTRITDYCDQHCLSTRERLDLFIKVCQAIQHAHQKGIIHRDIKPSNILVTLHDGVPVPKVIDFGIAKATTDQRLTDKTLFTALEQFMGTPAYMSPEQAEMSGLDVDTRSDIYSLGVLLYELLTGKTPFDGKELVSMGLDAMRRTIRESEPAKPSTKLAALARQDLTTTARQRSIDTSTLSHQLQGDLDWIVMKCLEKDRTRRYETANGLATDLKRHLNNEPVTARPPSAAYKFQKAFRRNRLMFTAIGTIAVLILAGSGIISWLAFRATEAKGIAIAERNKAELAQAETEQQRSRAELEADAKGRALAAGRRTLYAADMLLAQQALASGNLGQTRELLKKHCPKTGEEDIRGWEWRYLWGSSASDESFTLGRHPNHVRGVAFSPKGGILASCSRDRTVRLWDLSTRAKVGEFVHSNDVQCLAFSRSGNMLVTAAHKKNVAVWDPSSKEEVWRIPIPNELTDEWLSKPVAFSPAADELVAVGDNTGVISLWDTAARVQLLAKRVTGNPVCALAFSSDGQRLGVGSESGEIQICAAGSLRSLVSMAHGKSFITSLAFSRDNSMLASSAYVNSTITLWDVQTGSVVGLLTNHTAGVEAVAFLPDGRRLVSASFDHSIRFWDLSSFSQIARLQGHENEVHTLSASPNGDWLATGSKDNSVKLWTTSLKPVQQTHLVLGANRDDQGHAISADRKMVLSRLLDGTMQLRDAKNLSLLRSFRSPITDYSSWALSPAGRDIAFGQTNGQIRLWGIAEERFLVEFKAHEGPVASSRYSSDGRTLATYGADERVRVWEVHSGKVVHDYSAPHRMIYDQFTLSANAQKLALAYHTEQDDRGLVRLWDLARGREITSMAGHLESIWGLAFSSNGEAFVTGTTDGTAKLWDVHDLTGPRLALRGAMKVVNSVAFSPDDRRLAVSGVNGETRIWDLSAGLELLTLKGGDGFIIYSFFVDDDVLLTAGGTRGPQTEFYLWRAPSFADIAASEAKEKN